MRALSSHVWIVRRVERGRAGICRARHIALGFARDEQQAYRQQNNEAAHEPLVSISDVLASGASLFSGVEFCLFRIFKTCSLYRPKFARIGLACKRGPSPSTPTKGHPVAQGL